MHYNAQKKLMFDKFKRACIKLSPTKTKTQNVFLLFLEAERRERIKNSGQNQRDEENTEPEVYKS